MALVAVEIPKVGLVMETVRIVRWLKNIGDVVKIGEPLLEVETEKSMVEIEASVGGRLHELLASVDQELQVGDRIAWMETGEASVAAQPATATAAAPAAPAPRAKDPTPPQTPPASARPAPASSPAIARQLGRLRSSPYARRLAAEHGVDLQAVAGSGPGGRIQSADLHSHLAPGGEPLSPMRRAVARAMSLSNATVPQFLVERSFNCATVQALRAEYDAAAGDASPRLSVNDFLLQAVARTLIEQPALNATFAGDAGSANARLVPARGAHVGLVVAVEGGLLVPVIHDAQDLGLRELARRRRDCVARALAGRLRRDELEGATFSISNLGANGPDRFTATINPPQSAILAVGRQRDVVIAGNGGYSVQAQSTLTLTVDHRVADGRLASKFLARLVQVLEARSWQA